MRVPVCAGIVAGVVMQIFSYYVKGAGVAFWSLRECRLWLRDMGKIDPNRVQPFEYWSEEERRTKRAYIKRVSSSGAVRWFGIY